MEIFSGFGVMHGKKIGVFVDLSARRRDTLLNAHYKFQENMSVRNLFIILKILCAECIYTLIKKIRSLKKI